MLIRLRSYSTLTFCHLGSANSIETSIALFSFLFLFPHCVWACPYAVGKQKTESLFRLSMGKLESYPRVFSVCGCRQKRSYGFVSRIFSVCRRNRQKRHSVFISPLRIGQGRSKNQSLSFAFVLPLRMSTPRRNGETKKENRAIDVSIGLADPRWQKMKLEYKR